MQIELVKREMKISVEERARIMEAMLSQPTEFCLVNSDKQHRLLSVLARLVTYSKSRAWAVARWRFDK